MLAFIPDGTIATGFFNVQGCRHDSTIADWGEVYTKLAVIHEKTYPFLFKSLRDDVSADVELLDIEDQLTNIAIKRDATSMIQSSEWGMRAV
jgi:hypothetical protein